LQDLFVKCWPWGTNSEWTTTSMSKNAVNMKTVFCHSITYIGCCEHFVHFCSCFAKFETELHVCILHNLHHFTRILNMTGMCSYRSAL
jgi:hypothetical protein